MQTDKVEETEISQEKQREFYRGKYKNIVDIEGVGTATLEKLTELGFSTIESLSIATPDELTKGEGIGDTLALKLINESRKTISLGFIKADEMLAIRDQKKYLTTGCYSLNELLCVEPGKSGIETQGVTEFYGEFGCHSEDTLILTPNGVEDWRSKSVGDKILGMSDGKICHSEILEVFEYDFDEYLNEIDTGRVNLCITDKHTVYHKNYHKQDEKEFELKPVSEISKTGYLKCCFDFDGIVMPTFDIQKYIEIPESEHPEKSRAKDLLESLDTGDFLELVGYYIADGSPLRNEYAVYPTIRNARKLDKLEELVNKLGLDYSIYEDSKVVIFHRDLGLYLMRCGDGALNKTIPEELRSLSQIDRLFDGLMNCDAHHNGYTYYTSSIQLRDQFLILCMKLGFNVSYRKASMKEYEINGRIIQPKAQPYYINISYHPKGSYDNRNGFKKVRYKGKVWCYRTSTGNFFTVRGGQPTLSGNSGKSQLCHQFAVTVQLPIEQGGFNARALYIDTEDIFQPRRCIEIGRRFGMSKDEVLDGIIVAQAYTSKHQMALLENADSIIKQENIKLIIVDSSTGQFRAEYIGREMLSGRQQQLNKHLTKLHRMSRVFNASAVITNQVSATPDASYWSKEPNAIGGHVLGHLVHTRIYLRKSREPIRIAKILASPSLPVREAPFKITEFGCVSDDDMPDAEESE